MASQDGRNGAGKLVKALGIFSIGLGAMELFMPGKVAAIAGIHGASPNLVRSYGVREIGAGLAILATGDPLGAVISRVATGVRLSVAQGYEALISSEESKIVQLQNELAARRK